MHRRSELSRRGGHQMRSAIFAALAATAFAAPYQAFAVNTTFTNANNNLLWGDPGNWTNGVPTSIDTAVFATPAPGAVDLGNLVRPVLFLRLNGNAHVLGNGTLEVGSSFSSVVADGSVLINANLTKAAGGVLQLSGSGLN